MRQIIFSRVFPKQHPRSGEPTFFVEKILVGKLEDNWANGLPEGLSIDITKVSADTPKVHTIRAGNRWKVGDKFIPRVWSDKPYRSKTIQFAPPIEIKKIWDFQKDLISDDWLINGKSLSSLQRIDLAINDGLDYKDMLDWFSKPFTGQIICWDEKLEY